MGIIVGILVWLLALGFGPAGAQEPVQPYFGVVAPSGQKSFQPIDQTHGLPTVSSNAFVNVTTAASTVVKASPGVFVGLNVNTVGAGSSLTVYNNTVCSGAKIGTFDTSVAGSVSVGAFASVGICATSAGGTPADITVLYQ